jgi:hypothetical protein
MPDQTESSKEQLEEIVEVPEDPKIVESPKALSVHNESLKLSEGELKTLLTPSEDDFSNSGLSKFV